MLAGIGAYSSFNYSLSGKPLAWYDAITYWGIGRAEPSGCDLGVDAGAGHTTLSVLTSGMGPYDTLNALAALGALALAPVIWRRFNALATR